MGIPWHCCCGIALCHAPGPPGNPCRETAIPLQQGVRLWIDIHNSDTLPGEYWNDYRAPSGNRYTTAFFQLWRVIPAGIYRIPVHIPETGLEQDGITEIAEIISHLCVYQHALHANLERG